MKNKETEDGTEDDTDDDTNDDTESKGFYEKSISEHIDGKQVLFCERSRLRVVKFQFSWYELIPHGKSEDRQYSGRLYRDALKRSLQLQSFMVSPTHEEGSKDELTGRDHWSMAADRRTRGRRLEILDTGHHGACILLSQGWSPKEGV